MKIINNEHKSDDNFKDRSDDDYDNTSNVGSTGNFTPMDNDDGKDNAFYVRVPTLTN